MRRPGEGYGSCPKTGTGTNFWQDVALEGQGEAVLVLGVSDVLQYQVQSPGFAFSLSPGVLLFPLGH